MDTIEEINLTALQKAKKKYYEKIKNDPDYIKQRRTNGLKHYYKIKDDPEFKRKVSDQKKEYYQRTKINLGAILDIIV